MGFIIGFVLSKAAFADNLLTPKVNKNQAIEIAKKYLINKYKYPKDFKDKNISINIAERKSLNLQDSNIKNDQWVVQVVPKVGFGGCIVYVDDQTGDVDRWAGLE